MRMYRENHCDHILIIIMYSKANKYILHAMVAIVIVAIAAACGSAKLSVAEEQMARGEYHDASRTYRNVYNKLTRREERALRGEVAFKMGLCYRKLNQSGRAAAAFGNALRYAYPDSMTHFYLGQALQAEGKYRDAIEAYMAYLATSPKGAALAETGIAGCRKGLAVKESPTRYVVKQSKLFNSRRADFAPMFAGANHDVLYFTTTNEKALGDHRSEITGMKKGDIWVARKNEQGQWQRPEAVEGDLNSDHDEGVVSITADGSTMYLTRARREPNAHTAVEIYTSQRSDAKWSTPVKLEITADTLSSYGHPAVSPDGERLVFASDMPGGVGGLDLWVINLKERGGSLQNLGEFINTPGDECFPYWRSDSVLYFSSDGHAGLGGLDLFRAELTPSGGWSVVNMGAPMNSAADDFGITYGDGESGYFSSNRGDGRGYDHIYSFVLPDLKINISGMVLDKDEEPVANSVIRIVGDDGSNQKAVGKADGSFMFPLQRGVRYVMMAGAKGYLNAKQEFQADTAEVDAEYVVDFILAAINKPNVVDNIFYDFDRATLRAESRTALDSIVQVLRDNPNVTIEMASHTDRHGSEEYNRSLSERRAKSVTDYLVAAGIRPERLRPQGYGKSQPKTITKRLARLYPQFKEGDTLTEEYILALPDEADRERADQINRRTEFQVLSVDFKMF